jgi:phospholipid-translocating P-type ATPase (flippase)
MLFIPNDIGLYDDVSDQCAIANNGECIDALGQVDFLFTDKTGTLTSNEMILLHITTPDGTIYGTGETKFYDERLKDRKWKNDATLERFVTLLSICNTVIPVVEDDITYQSASIDEEALVQGACEMGLQLIARSPYEITLMGEVEKKYTILHVIEFSFERKRMSIIVRDENNQVRLLCKGADNIMKTLLHENQDIETTMNTVLGFSRRGLRTLLCADRIIDEQTYNQWRDKLQIAIEANGNVSEILNEIEVDMTLVGATAIEDKLQKNVPETISALREAGIRTWMLTGDKRETACVISRSCAMIEHETTLFELYHQTNDEIETAVREQFEKLRENPHLSYAIIIDGITLEILVSGGEERTNVRSLFLKLCLTARAVICYRVSPNQKALAVQLIKNGQPNAVTLAIGDGANDVSMLKVANIGIGIMGKEGIQAVNASDFSTAQFSFLKKLLFVHGRWNYRRVCKVVLLQLYTLVVLQFGQLWYFFMNGSTGTVSVDSNSYRIVIV